MSNRIQVFSSNLRSHLQGWYEGSTPILGSGAGREKKPGSQECLGEFMIYIWYLVLRV